MIDVFHGSDVAIPNPDVTIGRSNLDFGKGFYLTTYRKQAEEWAFKKSKSDVQEVFLNIYSFDEIKAKDNFRYLKFNSYNKEWLDFVAESRNGIDSWKNFDVVEGGVADDRVIDTVNLYMQSFISEAEALRRLSMFVPNNQICILSQEVVNTCLSFKQSVKIVKGEDIAREIILWGKIGHIILLLAERLNISKEKAMDIFYNSEVNKELHDPNSDLYTFSDRYIVDEILESLNKK